MPLGCIYQPEVESKLLPALKARPGPGVSHCLQVQTRKTNYIALLYTKPTTLNLVLQQQPLRSHAQPTQPTQPTQLCLCPHPPAVNNATLSSHSSCCVASSSQSCIPAGAPAPCQMPVQAMLSEQCVSFESSTAVSSSTAKQRRLPLLEVPVCNNSVVTHRQQQPVAPLPATLLLGWAACQQPPPAARAPQLPQQQMGGLTQP